jgi:hypothetical protein
MYDKNLSLALNHLEKMKRDTKSPFFHTSLDTNEHYHALKAFPNAGLASLAKERATSLFGFHCEGKYYLVGQWETKEK